ncbi:papilin-like [Bolinopsis microptera]|uniref:papilin-like n=1 Tax=Bolinopsis microptera TaxID=2820187 RepID=UPI003079E856
MISVLALTLALSTLVNSNNIFADFASSICQQRYELNGDVVCQPDGEFAARQCSEKTGVCYCATETGEIIDGTQFNQDRNHICNNVQYDVEYKHQHRNAGFNVQEMLSEENQLTRKLLDMDKKNAVWEMRSIVITRHSTDKDYSVYEALLVGYNTRLSQEDIVKKLRNVLGSRDSGTDRLKVRQVYTSVHEGECPAAEGPCDESTRKCYSDSECGTSEICCQTECEHRCIPSGAEPTIHTTAGSTSEITSPIERETTAQPTGKSTTTMEWYRTSQEGRTEPLGTETEALTSHDWSTTDSSSDDKRSTTEDSTEGGTTDPFTTEKLLMTSTGTTDETSKEDFSPSQSQTEEFRFETSDGTLYGSTTEEVNFPSTAEYTGSTEEPKSTRTPSYTEKTVETTEPEEGSTADDAETFTTQEYGPSSESEASTEYKTTFVNSLGSEATNPISEEYMSTEEKASSPESERTIETDFTTDVTGFVSSTEPAPTDPLSFFETTSPEGSDSMTYYTQQLTSFTDDVSDSQTIDLKISDTVAFTTKPIVTSSQMKSLCEQEASQAIGEGRDGPLCLDSGSFSPQQCDTNRGICWCVDEEGLELKGSRRYGSADCDSFRVTTPPMTTTEPMGDCWRAYQKAIKEQAYDRGVMLPTCQSNGLYAKSQCHGTYCWCVNELNGVMVNGTRKPGPIDCELYVDGVCPEYAREHDSVCINKCDADESCYGTTKCCQTHCGRDCVYPQLPEQLKEGQCPAPQSMNTIFEQCAVECNNDQDCDDATKCCFNGCGYSCSAAIYDANIYCKKVDSLYKGEVLDPRDQYTEGDVLKLECDEGYELQGHQEIRCLADGDWEHELPTCKRISCGVPGSGQFMVVRGSDYFAGGEIAYHCYSGYELIGNSSAICLVSGRWNSEPPTCQRVECPEMNELPYGRVYGRMMTYGNRIGFRCDYGYTLVGSEQRLCLSDGSWSGTDPTCVRGYFSRSRRNKFGTQNEEGSEFGNGKCQYAVTSTIDFNGECLEDVITIDCQCGEPDSVEQKVKVLCQRGVNEFVERTVKIGKDCSCCV